MDIGKRIKEYRKRSGLTQKQLSEKLGLPYQSIGQWENGLRNPKYDTLQLIANALNVPIVQLIDENEVMQKRAEYLVDTYKNGVAIWIHDKALSDEEQIRLSEHYADFLLKYKQIINAIVDAKYSPDMQRDIASAPEAEARIKSAYFREYAQEQLDDLKRWIDCMPEYVSRTDNQPKEDK